VKTISVTINDLVYEKFVRIQKDKGFTNQSDTLEFVIEEVSKRKGF
jgi:predicted CopG family antitoxin